MHREARDPRWWPVACDTLEHGASGARIRVVGVIRDGGRMWVEYLADWEREDQRISLGWWRVCVRHFLVIEEGEP